MANIAKTTKYIYGSDTRGPNVYTDAVAVCGNVYETQGLLSSTTIQNAIDATVEELLVECILLTESRSIVERFVKKFKEDLELRLKKKWETTDELLR
jgi:hypothetical protein